MKKAERLDFNQALSHLKKIWKIYNKNDGDLESYLDKKDRYGISNDKNIEMLLIRNDKLNIGEI